MSDLGADVLFELRKALVERVVELATRMEQGGHLLPAPAPFGLTDLAYGETPNEFAALSYMWEALPPPADNWVDGIRSLLGVLEQGQMADLSDADALGIALSGLRAINELGRLSPIKLSQR